MSSDNKEYEKNSDFIPTRELSRFLQKKHYEEAKLERKNKRLEEKKMKRQEKLDQREAKSQALWNSLKKASELEDNHCIEE